MFSLWVMLVFMRDIVNHFLVKEQIISSHVSQVSIEFYQQIAAFHLLSCLLSQTSDLFYFLVNKLHEYLPESRDKNALQNKSQRADELV